MLAHCLYALHSICSHQRGATLLQLFQTEPLIFKALSSITVSSERKPSRILMPLHEVCVGTCESVTGSVACRCYRDSQTPNTAGPSLTEQQLVLASRVSKAEMTKAKGGTPAVRKITICSSMRSRAGWSGEGWGGVCMLLAATSNPVYHPPPPPHTHTPSPHIHVKFHLHIYLPQPTELIAGV